MSNFLLSINNLNVEFRAKGKKIKVLSDVSFNLGYGETLGIVGESGCGKSMTALSIMNMIPNPPGRISSGSIYLNNEDLLKAPKQRLNEIRGNEISMIFQEPMTSLNPVFTIGKQLIETIIKHKRISKKEANEQAKDLLAQVQIPSPQNKLKEFPYQLSGGMRQRVMIAMALACNPKIIIADEPTTALDVTVQAQIFDLLHEIKEKFSTSIILITHDFGVITEMADKVMVMYAGHKIEEGKLKDIVGDPKHPYTIGLLNSMPEIKNDVNDLKNELPELAGNVPDLFNLHKGCVFGPRCKWAKHECLTMPEQFEFGVDRKVKCWLAET